jgi:5'-phosphate synthase pdxT subunit
MSSASSSPSSSHSSSSSSLPPSAPPITIGVLALQGAFLEHLHSLRQLGIACCEVRTAEQLAACDGLIIPGGESTAIALLAQREHLLEPLRLWSSQRRPVFGTCAGLILLSDVVTGQKRGGQELIGGLHISAQRNHYGTQLGSFRSRLQAPALADVSVPGVPVGSGESEAVFIRAPGIVSVGEGVEVLATIPKEVDALPSQHGKRQPVAGAAAERGDDDEQKEASAAVLSGAVDYRSDGIAVVPVAVREGSILATTFHPELTKELRWHALFADMVRRHCQQSRSERRHAVSDGHTTAASHDIH